MLEVAYFIIESGHVIEGGLDKSMISRSLITEIGGQGEKNISSQLSIVSLG